MAAKHIPLNKARAKPGSDAPKTAGGGASRVFATGFFGLSAALGAGFVALTYFGSPSDGNPVVTIALPPFAAAPAVSEEPPSPPPAPLPFVNTRMVEGKLVADPALIEDSPEGPLPIIGKDGKAPMTAYAAEFDRADKKPKIAIVLARLGVSAAGTAAALTKLPPQVTFAFAPFAPGVQGLIDKARGAGHEVLLQVPMEPADYPDSDPGPHALLVASTPEENVTRLAWAMTRFTGYVGIGNLLGGRILTDAPSIEPVLAEATKRGLIFFDDGVTPHSLTIPTARRVGTTVASGTLTIDSIQTASAIEAKLTELEARARRDGFAIGVASPYPVSIARLADWTAGLVRRGFTLAPLSGLSARPAAAARASTSSARAAGASAR